MLENTTSDDIIKIVDHMKDIITPIGAEVYKIYYKQMVYSGILGILTDLIILAGFALSIYFIYNFCKSPRYDDFKYWIDDSLAGYISVIVIAIIFVIFSIVAFAAALSIQEDLMHILNPDYYIIQTLLNR